MVLVVFITSLVHQIDLWFGDATGLELGLVLEKATGSKKVWKKERLLAQSVFGFWSASLANQSTPRLVQSRTELALASCEFRSSRSMEAMALKGLTNVLDKQVVLLHQPSLVPESSWIFCVVVCGGGSENPVERLP